MSVPEKHHYLPVAYLSRWVRNGTLVRFVRPRGIDHDLHMKQVSPTAIAYQRDLYAIPTAENLADRQMLELNFYQKIDDRAAKALDLIDRDIKGTAADRMAFAQFVLSLPLRNPAQIEHVRNELRQRIGSLAEAPFIEDHLTSNVNLLVAGLIESSSSVQQIASMKVFKICIDGAKKCLLTSDRPTMLSASLVGRDAFILFPYSPTRLIVLANDEKIARAFSSQDPDILVNAVNDAVVRQAQSVVIASDSDARDFVDERFLRHKTSDSSSIDPNGMFRWKSPLIRVRNFGKSALLRGTTLSRGPSG